MGWDTAQITSSKHYLDTPLEEDIDGLHFYRTPQPKGLMAKLPVLNQLAVIQALTSRLDEVVKVVKPDVLHAHSPALNGVAALRVGRCQNIPVVYEVRAFWEDAAADHGTSLEGGLRYRMTRIMETYVLRRADAVTAICEGLRQDIIARGIPESKVTVIPNAVDIERFEMSSKRDAELVKKLGLENAQVLGFIGSFYAYEGLPLLVDALPRVLAEMPNTRVMLVGGGPQESQLKEQAKALGLADKVVFTGRVPHNEVQRYYNLVDVFVYPRLPMRLTDLVTPLKPLEAMAQGRIVLASDVGGHRELIEHGRNGFLFKAADAQALADAVIKLLQSREGWEELRHAGRYFVQTERSWPVSVGRYRDVYGDLVQQSGEPR